MNNPWNPDELRFCPAFATPPQAPRALDGDASRHASVLVEKIGKYHGNIMTSELISGKMMIDDEKWWKWSACKHKPWEMMTNETGGKYSVNFKKWFRHVPNFRAWMKMMEGVKRKHQSETLIICKSWPETLPDAGFSVGSCAAGDFAGSAATAAFLVPGNARTGSMRRVALLVNLWKNCSCLCGQHYIKRVCLSCKRKAHTWSTWLSDSLLPVTTENCK